MTRDPGGTDVRRDPMLPAPTALLAPLRQAALHRLDRREAVHRWQLRLLVPATFAALLTFPSDWAIAGVAGAWALPALIAARLDTRRPGRTRLVTDLYLTRHEGAA